MIYIAGTQRGTVLRDTLGDMLRELEDDMWKAPKDYSQEQVEIMALERWRNSGNSDIAFLADALRQMGALHAALYEQD